MSTIETQQIAARGLRFVVRAAGPADGEPVLLLHGFPETSAMWEALMRDLAAAGYRCLAPDQRGYSPDARPQAIEAYAYDELTADAFALADCAGWDRFHLIAHDWGAIIGWLMLERAGARIASFTALSIPEYRAFAEATWADADAEDYRKFLRLVLAPDGAAERVLGRDDLAGFKATWRGEPSLVDAYLSVLRQPGALTAALAWYRAADAHRHVLARPPGPPLTTPTLLMWGKNDPYVRPGSLARAESRMAGPHQRLDLDAGHWLVQEQFAVVRDAALAHLRANGAPLTRS